jgi:hypothetical protein
MATTPSPLSVPAEELEAALTAQDSEHRRLVELYKHDVGFSGPSLPATAALYLSVFCDRSVPAAKRRWVGLLVCKLIRTSGDVVDYLKSSSRQSSPSESPSERSMPGSPSQESRSLEDPTTELPKVAHIIIREDELEETRIIAGLIIRQALLQGIPLTHCWPDDKVFMNGVPFFPAGDGLNSVNWMSTFQDYLDLVAQLKLDIPAPGPALDPSILYPVSLTTSHGFRWRDLEPLELIALIQDGLMTILIPDHHLHNVGFVDIPLHRISRVGVRKAILHNSQALETEHEPWDVVISLKGYPWTYIFDAADMTGKEIAILFKDHKSAKECEACLMEWISSPQNSNASDSPKARSISSIITSIEHDEPVPKGLGQLDGPASEADGGSIQRPSDDGVSAQVNMDTQLTNVSA